jgi:hypothetical protein
MQINWFNLSIFVSVAVLFSIMLFDSIKQRLKKRKVQETAIQLAFDKTQLLAEIERLNGNKDLENSEGFVKFLSQSRDSAFNYIEKVQQSLKEFSEKVEPTFKWSKTYGATLGKNVHTEAIEKISEAYDRLKELLPEDNQTPNN